MKYYYELLESYNDLKKRKFTLSLVEQEGGDPESQLKSSISQAQSYKYSDPLVVTNANGETAYMWKSGDQKKGGQVKPGAVNFSTREDKQFPLRPEKDDEDKQKVLGWFSGEGDNKDQDDKKDQDSPIIDTPSPTQTAIDAEVAQFQETMTSMGANSGGIWQTDTEGGVRLGHTNPVASRSELQQRKIEGLAKEDGPELSTAMELQEVPNRITSSDLPEEERLAAVQVMNNTLKVVDKLEKGEPVSDEELKYISEHAKIDPRRGILFNDIYFVWKTKSAAAQANPFTKSLELVQKEIEQRNYEYSQMEQPDPFIRKIPILERDGSKAGKLYNLRGIGSEKFVSMSVKFSTFSDAMANGDKKKADKAKKEMGKLYEEMLATGTEQEIREAFKIGNDVRLGQLIANLDESQDAENIEAMKDYLMNTHGLDEEVVESLLDLGGTKPGVAIALMLHVERDFTTQLFGGAPDVEITVTGQDDSYSYGRKGDLRTVQKGMGKHYRSVLKNPSTSDNPGLFGGAITEDLDNVVIELKTTNDDGTKVNAGSTADKRFNDSDKGGGTPNEVAFLQSIDEGMDTIKPGWSDQARSAREQISRRNRQFDKALDYSEEGKNYGSEMIDTWKSNSKDKEAAKHTAKKAKEYLRLMKAGKTDQATPEQIEAFETVSNEITKATTADYLSKNSTDAGYLNEEATAYVLHRTITSCGSDEPCLRVARELKGGKQYAYDNNAKMQELSEKLSSGELRAKMTSRGITFVDKKGKPIPLVCKFEKTGWNYTIATKSLDEIKTSSELEESNGVLNKFLKAQEDLFRAFL